MKKQTKKKRKIKKNNFKQLIGLTSNNKWLFYFSSSPSFDFERKTNEKV